MMFVKSFVVKLLVEQKEKGEFKTWCENFCPKTIDPMTKSDDSISIEPVFCCGC
jgi:hypothetical protein